MPPPLKKVQNWNFSAHSRKEDVLKYNASFWTIKKMYGNFRWNSKKIWEFKENKNWGRFKKKLRKLGKLVVRLKKLLVGWKVQGLFYG